MFIMISVRFTDEIMALIIEHYSEIVKLRFDSVLWCRSNAMSFCFNYIFLYCRQRPLLSSDNDNLNSGITITTRLKCYWAVIG